MDGVLVKNFWVNNPKIFAAEKNLEKRFKQNSCKTSQQSSRSQ